MEMGQVDAETSLVWIRVDEQVASELVLLMRFILKRRIYF